VRPSLGRAILGGFVRTRATSFLMFTVAPLIGVRVDIAEMLSSMLGVWALGLLAHIVSGSIVFPIIYVFLVSRFLPGPPVAKGVMFGAGLWLMAQVLVMPMLAAASGVSQRHLGQPCSGVAGLADIAALRMLFGPEFPHDESKALEMTRQMTNVVLPFLIAIEEFMVSILVRRGWATPQVIATRANK